MRNLKERIRDLNWTSMNAHLLADGFVLIPRVLVAKECEYLISLFAEDKVYRSTIDMKRYNFGKGMYRYFKYPLPNIIQSMRETFYQQMAVTATSWSRHLKLNYQYPKTFAQFMDAMKERGQTRATPLILKYETGDYNCLHQDIAKDLIFPYQIVFGLTEKGKDYEGGQLILTQQRPRMQTIPHIISIPKGGAVIFTSNFHPQLGSRGYYRTVFKHGVGKILSGRRYTLGIVFHDYKEK